MSQYKRPGRISAGAFVFKKWDACQFDVAIFSLRVFITL